VSTFKEMMRRARADAQEGDWAPAPGTHDAIVVEGDAFESSAGDAYAKTTLRLVKPGHPDDGRSWDHLMGFKSPQQASMSAGQLSLYGISGEVMDELEDVDELAAAMAELEGVHVTVTCKARAQGDGVWTNITGSRTGKSDIPVEQGAFALGDGPAPPRSAIAGGDDDDIPF
jgi:hypothetical protein